MSALAGERLYWKRKRRAARRARETLPCRGCGKRIHQRVWCCDYMWMQGYDASAVLPGERP